MESFAEIALIVEAHVQNIESAVEFASRYADSFRPSLPVDEMGDVDEEQLFQQILAGRSPNACDADKKAAAVAGIYFGLQLAAAPHCVIGLRSLFKGVSLKGAAHAVAVATEAQYFSPRTALPNLEGSLADRLEAAAIRDWFTGKGFLDVDSHSLPPLVHEMLRSASSARFWISFGGPFDQERMSGAEKTIAYYFWEGLHLQSAGCAQLLTDMVLAIRI